MSLEKWWVSCRIFTVQVNVRGGVVVEAAPIVSKFLGQPFWRLQSWAKRFPPYREGLLGVEDGGIYTPTAVD